MPKGGITNGGLTAQPIGHGPKTFSFLDKERCNDEKDDRHGSVPTQGDGDDVDAEVHRVEPGSRG